MELETEAQRGMACTFESELYEEGAEECSDGICTVCRNGAWENRIWLFPPFKTLV